jgi:antitoxin (DNA-binding transcriptional repressor) of toxin-antitoxin stability system
VVRSSTLSTTRPRRALIPYGVERGGGACAGDDLVVQSGNPQLARLKPEHGAKLLVLGCELVWATSWGDEANDEISPRLNVPTLAIVDWQDEPVWPSSRGESFTITRNGTPIGRLIPLRRRTFVPREEALAAFATAPVLDGERFRADIDAASDQEPFNRAW